MRFRTIDEMIRPASLAGTVKVVPSSFGSGGQNAAVLLGRAA